MGSTDGRQSNRNAGTVALESRIGHRFEQPCLLDQALTHRSAASAPNATYERLEFLGDRVLGLVVADMLMRQFPKEAEGALARRLAALVRRETLADVATAIGLGGHLRVSPSEADAGGKRNPAILADACEALIGAIYRDGGLAAARRFIECEWLVRLRATERPPQDAKTALQEWAQGRGLPLPSYETLEQSGPDHAPQFQVLVQVEGEGSAKAAGPSKRVAEQAAARLLLDRLVDGDG